MTTQQQTERERLADLLEIAWQRFQVGTVKSKDLAVLIEAAALLRGDEPAKPDRYVVAWEAAMDEYVCGGWQAAAAVLRKNFPERPAVVVPFTVMTWARRYKADVGKALPRYVGTDEQYKPVADFILSLIDQGGE